MAAAIYSPSIVVNDSAASTDASTTFKAAPTSTSPKPTEVEGQAAKTVEFGGPTGAAALIVFSNVILFYFYYCIVLNGGNAFVPLSMADLSIAVQRTLPLVTPTLSAAGMYFGFLAMQLLFAFIMPGLTMQGRPDESGRRLSYLCNGLASWWATLLVLAVLHVSGTWRISAVVDNLGPLITVSVIAGNLFSVWFYMYAFLSGQTHRMTGSVIYDFFMGAILHPRIGVVDIKLLAEARLSWFLLFIIDLSCAVKEYENTGAVSPSAFFICLAHFLYANATAKGEHYIPSTWDLFYEKFGWMLCYWNLAGVPFLYCAQAVYIHFQRPGLGWPVIGVMTVLLLAVYYVWDTANSTKNHFRLETSGGTAIDRWTFPRLPGRILHNPKFIATQNGSPLLTDGWYRLTRKIHYTADIVFALLWGAACGFHHFLPFFYFFFFTGMIIHRYQRDMERCGKKYGKDWQQYCKEVPYAFIPYVW